MHKLESTVLMEDLLSEDDFLFIPESPASVSADSWHESEEDISMPHVHPVGLERQYSQGTRDIVDAIDLLCLEVPHNEEHAKAITPKQVDEALIANLVIKQKNKGGRPPKKHPANYGKKLVISPDGNRTYLSPTVAAQFTPITPINAKRTSPLPESDFLPDIFVSSRPHSAHSDTGPLQMHLPEVKGSMAQTFPSSAISPRTMRLQRSNSLEEDVHRAFRD